jgi:hypothetical protein
VDLILDGWVVREVYEHRSGLTGQSFSMYDASRHVWHQSWVTNRGHLLVLEGGMDGERIVLTGLDRCCGGPARTDGSYTYGDRGHRHHE